MTPRVRTKASGVAPRALSWTLTALLLGCSTTRQPVRQTPEGQQPASGPEGVLVMAHGGDEAWNRTVLEAVAPLSARLPAEVAFGMVAPSEMEAAVGRLEERGSTRIAVVRLFVSGESWLEETEYVLGLREALSSEKASERFHMAHHGHEMEPLRRIRARASFRLGREGIGESPLVGEILADRVKSLSKDPQREAVLILAHGPGDDSENARWLARMESQAKAVGALGPFRAVQCETLREDWPQKRQEAEQRIRDFVQRQAAGGARVLVVPFRVSGFGPYAKVLEGLEYVSDGRGLLPHPRVTEWIEGQASALLADRR